MTCRLRTLSVFCLSVLASIAFTALPVSAQSNDYIVSFQSGTSRADRAAAAGRHGAALRHNYGIIDAIAVTVPNDNALRALSQDASVRSITPDHPVYASQSANASENAKGKPGGSAPTTPAAQVTPAGVRRVGEPTGTSNGENIRVAIVDSGIDLAHQDLVVTLGYNAINPGASCQDDNGHGTHVAGIVAAQDNLIDVRGVAPLASLYCVKVLNAQGQGSWSGVIAGLDWLWNNGSPRVHVANMSLGGPGVNEDSLLRQAIERLHKDGVIIVVAAGNDPALDVSEQVPAAFTSFVVTVASTTATDGIAGCNVTVRKDTASYFTSDGKGVTISAPGAEREDITRRGPNCYLQSLGILSTRLGGGTTRMSGTSMAAPHVSGIVARLLQARPRTFGEIITYFDSSAGADLRGTAPFDSESTAYDFDFEREGIAVIR